MVRRKKSTEFARTLLLRHIELQNDGPALDSFTMPGLTIRIGVQLKSEGKFPLHFRSDFLAILFIQKGEVNLSVNWNTLCVKKNSLIFLGPDSAKKIISASAGALITSVTFTSDFLTSIGFTQKNTDLLNYFSSQFKADWQLSKDDSRLVQELISQLSSRGKNISTHERGKEILFHTFNIFLYELSALSKRYATLIEHVVSRRESLAFSFTRLVQKHFRTQRTVKSYAALLNITPKYLSETVREITGKTAGQIIDDFVLFEAKLLLDNPEYSIAEISDSLRFSDQSFFGKFFKRHTGLSPKDYRHSL